MSYDVVNSHNLIPLNNFPIFYASQTLNSAKTE
jgi:hypothetical protein